MTPKHELELFQLQLMIQAAILLLMELFVFVALVSDHFLLAVGLSLFCCVLTLQFLARCFGGRLEAAAKQLKLLKSNAQSFKELKQEVR